MEIAYVGNMFVADTTCQNIVNINKLILVVMGQGSSPARARPGARVFCRARGPSLVEGLKPEPGPGPWLKARGLKGLLKYDSFRKNVIFLDLS